MSRMDAGAHLWKTKCWNNCSVVWFVELLYSLKLMQYCNTITLHKLLLKIVINIIFSFYFSCAWGKKFFFN